MDLYSTYPQYIATNHHSYPAESWIEVSSQPSSSSVSSVADEIITDGLRVQQNAPLHRRRRIRNSALRQSFRPGAQDAGTESSSHDEYDESESESDQVLSSSNEAMSANRMGGRSQPSMRGPYSSASSENLEYDDDEEDDDDDENSTAINFPRGNTGHQSSFTPQPHAFSHPPAPQRPRLQRQPTSETYGADRSSTARPYLRHSSSSQGQQQHSPYNVISPSHAADHDAALRASLSTLLSCAAAARGLPRSNPPSQQTSARPPTTSRVDPGSLRMVPESVALGDDNESSSGADHQATSSRPTKPSGDAKGKSKTAPASTSRSNSKERRNTSTQNKKQRRSTAQANGAGAVTGIDDVSPTLLTWVLSAGVVVLVSALSFSAGYVVGRETGRTEAVGLLTEGTAGAGRCAGEVIGEVASSNGSSMGGLGGSWKRLRWSSAAVGGVSG
jgi:hypothetical protein